MGEPLEAPQQEQEVLRAAQAQPRGVRRRHGEDRLDEARHLDHGHGVLVIGLGVGLGVPGDLAARPAVVRQPPQVVAVQHRGERAVERQDLEAVPRQVEVADDLRAEERDDVGADRVLEARIDLLGDRRAAEHVAPLEHEHLAPRAREIRRVHQAVVAAADDDDIVIGHMRTAEHWKPEAGWELNAGSRKPAAGYDKPAARVWFSSSSACRRAAEPIESMRMVIIIQPCRSGLPSTSAPFLSVKA